MLAALVVTQSGCETARHRPITPADPTVISMVIPVREARLLLWHDGRNMPAWSVDHISEQAGRLVMTTIMGSIAIAGTFEMGCPSASFHCAAEMVRTFRNVLAPRPQARAPQAWDENCADRFEPTLYAVLRCYDADSGTFLDRHRLDGGAPKSFPVTIEPGQRVRLELSLDDGSSLVVIPLTILTASPGRSVSISVKAGPEAQAAAAEATKKAQARQEMLNAEARAAVEGRTP